MSIAAGEGAPQRTYPWTRLLPSLALWRSGLVEFWGRFPVLERRRTEFGLWWGDRTPRERRLLIALSGTATLALLVLAIYRPLAEARATAIADIRTYEVLAAQLRTAGPELARLRAMDRRAAPEVIAASAASFGLAIGRIEPEGADTRITLQDVDFVQAIQWLAQLESSSALRVSRLEVERRPVAGLVNARITLKS